MSEILHRSQANMRRTLVAGTLAVALIGVTAVVWAQVGDGFGLSWSTVDGGGATSSDGDFSLGGTAGQHDAGGPMAGGDFTVTGGFWAGAAPSVVEVNCTLVVELSFDDGITTWSFVVGATGPSTWSTSVIILGNDIPLWSIELPAIPPITISFSFPIPPIGEIEVQSTLAVEGGQCFASDAVDTGVS